RLGQDGGAVLGPVQLQLAEDVFARRNTLAEEDDHVGLSIVENADDEGVAGPQPRLQVPAALDGDGELRRLEGALHHPRGQHPRFLPAALRRQHEQPARDAPQRRRPGLALVRFAHGVPFAASSFSIRASNSSAFGASVHFRSICPVRLKTNPTGTPSALSFFSHTSGASSSRKLVIVAFCRARNAFAAATPFSSLTSSTVTVTATRPCFA